MHLLNKSLLFKQLNRTGSYEGYGEQYSEYNHGDGTAPAYAVPTYLATGYQAGSAPVPAVAPQA